MDSVRRSLLCIEAVLTVQHRAFQSRGVIAAARRSVSTAACSADAGTVLREEDMTDKLRIGVVGGAIAGTTSAILLSRLGHTVTLFEKSQGELVDRGAGIGLPSVLVGQLKDLNLMDRDVRGANVVSGEDRDTVSPRIWCVKDGETPYGRYLGTQPMAAELHHWGVLYRQLFKRTANLDIRRGVEVLTVENREDCVALGLSTGSAEEFDLVIGADGYRSRVRAALFPAATPEHAGYFIWRGLLAESDIDDLAPIDSVMQTVGTPQGHAAFFLVPSINGATGRGERELNWAWYDPNIPAELMASALNETSGASQVKSVNAGAQMPDVLRQRLNRLAEDQLPPWHRDVVLRTKAPYTQAIFDLELPDYIAGRVCLVGDSGSLARPHTVSGARKALQDSIALAEAVEQMESVSAALARYNGERPKAGNQLVGIGRLLGREQVFEAPDWNTMDENGFTEWVANSSLNKIYPFSGARR